MAVVAIVGLPNVGKSTLFNRLAGRRIAIVDDVPGVTRDRLYADVTWRGRSLTVIDSGGVVPDGEGELVQEVNRQVALATAEADVVVLVVDGRRGLAAGERQLADRLRRTGKPVVVAVNKVDEAPAAVAVAEFYALGFADVVPISAAHGRGTGDLLDRVLELLPPAAAEEGEPAAEDAARIAIVGRPNVGKSSLLNRLVGEERVIVSAMPGTTRDAVDVRAATPIGPVVFIDTAGMRRRSRIGDQVEYFSVVRAQRAIERSHVAVLVMDATELVTDQDKRVAAAIDEGGKACVLVVNKWDLVSDRADPDEAREVVRAALPLVAHADVVCLSARTGEGIEALWPAVRRALAHFRLQVQTAVLNRIIQDAVGERQPPSVGTRRLRIRYATQVRAEPPTFLIFVNDPELVVPHYRRYLENRLRGALDLAGTPVRLIFRADR